LADPKEHLLVNRALSSVAIGASLLIAVACSGEPPAAVAPPAANDETELPEASEIVDVGVTRPASPAPVDVKTLPPTARVVSQMPGLSADEKLCANQAIKTTLDGDPTIATTNAKMASVLGNSVVVCTPPPHLAAIISDGIAPDGGSLTPEQRTCLDKAVADDSRATARFLAALMTLDIATITTTSRRFSELCQVDVVPR
jgi:hypothetical protein